MSKYYFIFVFIIVGIVFCGLIGVAAEDAAENKKDKATEQIPLVEYTGMNQRDPLRSPIKIASIEENAEPEEVVVFPQMSLQGILWGGQKPAAIIDNKAFRAGDLVQEAKIIEINKNGVKLLYKNKEFFLEKETLKKGD